MRRAERLLRDGAHNRRATVVANGAVFAQAPHLPAAPAEPLLCDLLRHESRCHVGQDGIGRVGGGRKGGALPLLLLLLQSGSLLAPVAADPARRPMQPAKVAEVAARAVVPPAAVVEAQYRKGVGSSCRIAQDRLPYDLQSLSAELPIEAETQINIEVFYTWHSAR